MIRTVLGEVRDEHLGCMLPHEHILVGFVEGGALSPADYDREEVIRVMLPRLEALKAAGCGALAECTPEFLGRDPQLLERLSRLSGLHLLTNTGYYQAPYLAPFVMEATARELADIWVKEALDGIGGSGIRPGFIKIALSNGGPLPPVQRTILEAALRTSQETGLAIQAHTIGGEAMMEALLLMKEEAFDLTRFIWVHADSEPDTEVLKRAAGEGLWLSVDSIGWKPLEQHAALVTELLAAGLSGQILLSQDAGWYHVGEPGGGDIKPFTTLFTDFLPLLKSRGVPAETLARLTRDNPARSLALRA